MLKQQQRYTDRLGRVISSIVFAATLMLSPVHMLAQGTTTAEDRPSLLLDVTRRVIFDPTTYAPAIVGYDSTMRDWKSSQPFFQNGFVERNARFTVSGRPGDVPVSYQEGNKRILADAVANLQMSVVNNLTDSIFEHTLGQRYPTHRKLIRALGWIEKSAFASYTAYRLSQAHYRQWRQNEQTALQLGMK